MCKVYIDSIIEHSRQNSLVNIILLVTPYNVHYDE